MAAVENAAKSAGVRAKGKDAAGAPLCVELFAAPPTHARFLSTASSMKTTPIPIYAGVDGGGTKTRALVVAPDGRCLAHAVGDSSNINTAGAESAAANLEATLCNAVEDIGLAPNYAAAFFGMAGVNDSSAARLVTDLVNGFSTVKISGFEVANDTRALHAATFGVGSGIVLIVGTGSKCYGRADDGREWEAGGVDYLVSDEGSAHDIAVRGIKAALRAVDGRGPATSLERLIFTALRLSEYGEISQRLHQDSLENPGHPMTKAEIASLAKYVTQACAEGDAVARQVVVDALDSVLETVVAVARKLGFPSEGLQVGITGGVILNEPGAGIFKERLQKALPGAVTLVPGIPPVAGAAVRALALGGVAVTPAVIERLRSTLPEGL
jgi:N-acetylglucosamine kinase-like BadF-type ATPase